MTDQKHLEDGAEQEKDEENDGHSKDGLLQATEARQVWIVLRRRSGVLEARPGVAFAHRRPNVSIAAPAAGARHDGDSDESTEEEQIQDQGRKAETLLTADEERREQGQEGPSHGGGGNDLDRDDPSGRVQIMFVLDGKEVGKGAEDQERTQELDESQKRLNRLEKCAAERHDG